MKRRVIFSNCNTDYLESYRECYEEMCEINGIEPTESGFEDYLYEVSEMDWRFFRQTLGRVDYFGNILCLANLGLWNGRRKVYDIIYADDLSAILNTICGDYVEVAIEDGDIVISDTHNDGTNRYTFKAVRDTANIDNLYDALSRGLSKRQLAAYTTKKLARLLEKEL